MGVNAGFLLLSTGGCSKRTAPCEKKEPGFVALEGAVTGVLCLKEVVREASCFATPIFWSEHSWPLS